MFTIDPSTQVLFRSVDERAQRTKPLQALGCVIDGLDRVETILPMLEKLGRRHTDYGVLDRHYDSVGEARLWTLERGLEIDWTPAYGLAAGVMRRTALDAAAFGAPVTFDGSRSEWAVALEQA